MTTNTHLNECTRRPTTGLRPVGPTPPRTRACPIHGINHERHGYPQVGDVDRLACLKEN